MSEPRWESYEELERVLRKIVEDHAQPDPKTLAKLPKPTKKDNEKGKCDVCGGWHGLPAIHLDFMGHAEVTLALLDADPLWTWGAISDEQGLPIVDKQANRFVMWGWLEVCGVRRPCVGTCESNKPEPEKELIGDLLRNGAMRFGIGTKLWSKATDADAAGSGGSGGYDKPRRAVKTETPGSVVYGKLTDLSAETKALIAAARVDPWKLTVKSLDENPEWLDKVVAIIDQSVLDNA